LNYVCLLIDRRRIDQATAVEEKRFAAVQTFAEKAALARLHAERDAFLKAHGAEQPTGTTGIVQSVMREENETAQAWVQALQDFQAGKLPKFSPEEFRAADAKLNAAYKAARVMASEICGPAQGYCTRPEDIQKAERIWLRYREAWVVYAALRWPEIPADSWRTWLTIDRTAMLGDN
jgi:uncharacterized protein YecT (DUF1311 family)